MPVARRRSIGAVTPEGAADPAARRSRSIKHMLQMLALLLLAAVLAGCGAEERRSSASVAQSATTANGWTAYAPPLKHDLPPSIDRALSQRGIEIHAVHTDPRLAAVQLPDAVRQAAEHLPQSGKRVRLERVLPFLVDFVNDRDGTSASAGAVATPSSVTRLAWLLVILEAASTGDHPGGTIFGPSARAWVGSVDAESGQWLFGFTTPPLADKGLAGSTPK